MIRPRGLASAAAGGTGHGGGGGALRVPAGEAAHATPADLARLSQAERAERALAEGRRERSVPIDRAFLAAALDFRETLRILVAVLVPGFADWCLVDLVDGNGIPRRVEVAHADPAKAPLAQELREIGVGPGWATPGAQAIRDRAPRLYPELTPELLTWATHDARHRAALEAMRPNSLLAFPLVARGQAIGAVTVVRSAMLPGFDEADLVFAEDLAVPAALALDGARHHERERAARRAAEDLADRERAEKEDGQRAAARLRRIESLSATLAAALSPEAIARVTVGSGLSLLEPSTALVVHVTAAGDRLEVLHAVGWPAELGRFLPVDAPALVAEAYRSQTAIGLETEDALVAAYPTAAASPVRPPEQAFAAIPLRVDGRTIGALRFGYPRPRDLDAEERRYVLTVAQLAAQALERARLRDR